VVYRSATGVSIGQRRQADGQIDSLAAGERKKKRKKEESRKTSIFGEEFKRRY
jgi:hypothetical protein